MDDATLRDRLYTAWHFARTRWLLRFTLRADLERWQARQLARFLREVLPRAPWYAGAADVALCDLPTMDKRNLVEEFDQRNTRSIARDDARRVALQAEHSRDFAPAIGDVSVGMSSGTSGSQALFLVSKEERLRWAGVLLAKTLPTQLLLHVLAPWRPPLRIAFFLRANNNLYATLNSSRIDFRFFDLLQGTDSALRALNATPPDVLVAPATVLRHLAEAARAGKLGIRPLHIVSVAEVLETDDARAITLAFGRAPHQIYQATEGFLGYTCERGNLHLNETHLHIEKEWLDADQQRFQPVITDFSRTTQLIVRYRLNDVLRRAAAPCSCGRAETHIAAIEGRADEVLWLQRSQDGTLQPLYPDLLRRAMLLVEPALTDYRIEQRGECWLVEFATDGERAVASTRIMLRIADECARLGLRVPQLAFAPWQAPAPGAKRRRLSCITRAGEVA